MRRPEPLTLQQLRSAKAAPGVRTVAEAVEHRGPEVARWASTVDRVKRAPARKCASIVASVKATDSRSRRSAEARCGSQGRAPRAATNARSRGSRRVASRSSGGSDSGDSDDGEPEPPELRFWRHPTFGRVTPNLYRLLLAESASAAGGTSEGAS